MNAGALGCAAQLMLISLLLSGCGSAPNRPHDYVTAPTGAKSAQQLVENLEKAYSTRDTDSAMKLFFWDKGVPQDYWWQTLQEMFATGYDTMELVENDKTMDDPSNKTSLPVDFLLRISPKEHSAKTGSRLLLIGKTENGFYFASPIWDEL